MKISKLKLLCLFPLFALAQQKNNAKEIPFTYKNFMNLVNYFDSKKDVLDFFDFKNGDVVADIGAGEGKYEGIFSLLTDSVTFYAQDINSKLLNQKSFDKTVQYYSELKKQVQTNKFRLQIGTEKTTNLPDGIFDKVLILSAFHEFTFADEMIDDIAKKIKPTGRVYIVDSFCGEKGHVNYTAEEVIAKMKKHGFELVKQQGKDKNGSTGLYEAVFRKA